MSKIDLEALSKKIVEKRGSRGVRETAKEIGISHATLSRVERGYLPDLETFGKICQWLNVDPGKLLGIQQEKKIEEPQVTIHFRKKQTIAPKTAQALAKLILAAQREIIRTAEENN